MPGCLTDQARSGWHNRARPLVTTQLRLGDGSDTLRRFVRMPCDVKNRMYRLPNIQNVSLVTEYWNEITPEKFVVELGLMQERHSRRRAQNPASTGFRETDKEAMRIIEVLSPEAGDSTSRRHLRHADRLMPRPIIVSQKSRRPQESPGQVARSHRAFASEMAKS